MLLFSPGEGLLHFAGHECIRGVPRSQYWGSEEVFLYTKLDFQLNKFNFRLTYKTVAWMIGSNRINANQILHREQAR